MLNKLFKKIDQYQIVIKIERAINDLRKGLPIILDNNHLLFASEAVDNDTLNDIDSSHKAVIISKNRAKSIGIEANNNIGIKIDILSEKNIENLILSSEFKIENAEYDHIEIYDTALHLMNLSELLPSAILLKDIPFNSNLIQLASEEVKQYSELSTQNFKEICTAEIDLPYAKNVKMITFRPIAGGKEHYAIIVGDIAKEESPIVRVHSSCYTGDLLQSLSCDCYEQLTSSIKLISSSDNKSGIILYLMQEGRGIGLTNKLRTQILQDKGFDIVDSNKLLGFEDDQRSFGLASKLLKLLNISQIRLLTNNPKKISSLEENGIKVKETISLIGDGVEKKEFFKTKIKKLGHIVK